VKLIQGKGSAPAKGEGDTAADTVKVSQSAPEAGSAPAASGAEVISPVEMGVRFAAWLDTVDMAKLSTAEAKAIAEVTASIDAFRAKVADAAKTPARKAA
jgi:hypothetical protein